MEGLQDTVKNIPPPFGFIPDGTHHATRNPIDIQDKKKQEYSRFVSRPVVPVSLAELKWVTCLHQETPPIYKLSSSLPQLPLKIPMTEFVVSKKVMDAKTSELLSKNKVDFVVSSSILEYIVAFTAQKFTQFKFRVIHTIVGNEVYKTIHIYEKVVKVAKFNNMEKMNKVGFRNKYLTEFLIPEKFTPSSTGDKSNETYDTTNIKSYDLWELNGKRILIVTKHYAKVNGASIGFKVDARNHVNTKSGHCTTSLYKYWLYNYIRPNSKLIVGLVNDGYVHKINTYHKSSFLRVTKDAFAYFDGLLNHLVCVNVPGNYVCFLGDQSGDGTINCELYSLGGNTSAQKFTMENVYKNGDGRSVDISYF